MALIRSVAGPSPPVLGAPPQAPGAALAQLSRCLSVNHRTEWEAAKGGAAPETEFQRLDGEWYVDLDAYLATE